MTQEVLLPNGERVSRAEIRQRAKMRKEQDAEAKKAVKGLKEPEKTEAKEPEKTEAKEPEKTEAKEPEKTEAKEPEKTEDLKEVDHKDIDHLSNKVKLVDLQNKAQALGLDVHGFNKTECREAIEAFVNPEL